ncbi:MAG TPA: dTMP kinase, partial [Mycobacteriales bacterium]|nr:dTMP kinase [Mycobacteriales bacterium]
MSSPPPPVGPSGPPHPGEAAPGPGAHGVRGVLQITVFRRLYVALAMSSMGDWLGFLATTALAAQLMDTFAGKAYATGGVLVFRLLPAVLFGPLAGAFADRWDRRTTMVVCDLLRFALFLSIPLVGVWSGGGTPALVWLLAASFLIETVSLFWIPAKEASVPNIVPRERLESANQLTLVATYGSAPVAAAVFAVLSLVSGALGNQVGYFATGPVDLALYVNAATFLFAAATVYRLRDLPSPSRRDREAGVPTPSVVASLREGFGFMGRTPLTRGLLVGMLGALAAGGAIIALGRLFAETVLGGGDAAYGLLFGAMFLGIALGVALGPRALGDLSRRRAFGPSIVGAGASLVVMSLVPVLAVAALATVAVGFFAGIAYVVGITLLGLEVDDALRGRMFGLVQSLMRIDLLLVTASAPFVAGAVDQRQFAVGPLDVDLNGVSVVLLLGGVLGVVVGVVSHRQMDDRRGVPLRADLLALLRRSPHVSGLPGRFVALEGGEGAGKSTQLALLADWLRAQGHEVVVTREPGATPAGGRIRQVLLDPETGRLAPRAEALLYAADRAQHVAEVVRPALARGCVVLTDRYVDSSLAYQGAGRELERDDVARLSRWATEGLVPDLVVLLDVDPAVGLARATAGHGPDRIEAESLAFHQRVRSGFLALAAKAPERYLVLDADRPAEQVHADVRERLAPLLT